MTALLKLLSGRLWKMPRPELLRWGRAAGFFLGRVLRFRRAEVFRAMALAFPDMPTEELAAAVNAMYAHFGMNMAESLMIDRIDLAYLERHVAVENKEEFFRALERGRGVVALTAHIGNFELMCLKATAEGVPLTVITKSIKPKFLNDYWTASRCKFGMKTVPHHNSALACRGVLRRNGVLGFIFDQNMKRHEGVFVPFFGRPACTSPGLAFLSASCRSPVVPVFITRNPDGSHTMRVETAIEPPPDASEQAVLQATAEYTAVLERAVRRAPEQWLWLHRRWRTRPAENGGK